VNELIDRYFKSVKINTPFDIENIILITRKELKLDFDMELVVESCSNRKGFIMPGYTLIQYHIDNSMNAPKTF
jgi:hypothetical protein